MRTTVLKAMATVALFVTGLTNAVAQLEPSPPVVSGEVLSGIEQTIQSSPLPESQKSQLIRDSRRIVGGLPTSIDRVPWQVALIKGADPSRSQFCGGSIIDPEWVITAAHCVDNSLVNKSPARVNVIAGTTTWKSGGERVAVKRIFVHPAWNSANQDNDVALLHLGRRLTLTGSNMRAIPLVAAGSTAEIEPTTIMPLTLTVTGWGAVLEGGSGSDALRFAVVPAVPNTVCNEPSRADSGRIHL
jgi:trypsin